MIFKRREYLSLLVRVLQLAWSTKLNLLIPVILSLMFTRIHFLLSRSVGIYAALNAHMALILTSHDLCSVLDSPSCRTFQVISDIFPLHIRADNLVGSNLAKSKFIKLPAQLGC